VVETIAGDPINDPWDMTAVDRGSSATLFVTNVLNGTVAANGGTVDQGTVVRIRLRTHHGSIPVPTAIDVIATGFAERTDPMALVVGPTGAALASGDHGDHGGGHRDRGHGERDQGDRRVLYVADTVNSRIAAIPDALDRTTAFSGGGDTVSSGQSLNGPLGLALAPGGDIITANGGDGNFVETTPFGEQVASKTVEPGRGWSSVRTGRFASHRRLLRRRRRQHAAPAALIRRERPGPPASRGGRGLPAARLGASPRPGDPCRLVLRYGCVYETRSAGGRARADPAEW
jgi:hypothetical protein